MTLRGAPESSRSSRRSSPRARFVVVPSEWYENYPYAILEAFALARPVVGARIGGIPELVRDGETGMTARPGDPDALAEALACDDRRPGEGRGDGARRARLGRIATSRPDPTWTDSARSTRRWRR